MIWGLNPSRDRDFFSFPKHPDWPWDPPSLFCSGYQGSFPGVIQPGHENDHSPASSTKVKNGWSHTSNAPLCLHGIDKEHFYLLLYVQICEKVDINNN
jgi:hypothetical protein